MSFGNLFVFLRVFRHTLLLGAIAIIAKESNAAKFTPLGFLDGGTYSDVANVSADGRVVVGTAISALGVESFTWTAQTGMHGLGDFPTGDFWSNASAVSTDGSYIVGRGTAGSYAGVDGYRWNAATGMEAVGYLNNDPSQFRFSYATAVSGDGQIVVGGSHSELGNEAFRWTEDGGIEGLGQLTGAPIPNYSSNISTGISSDGSVIVGNSRSESVTEPFRWTEEDGMVGIGFLSGLIVDSYANAVSADGETIVGYSNQGWLWTEATGIIPLSSAPDVGSKLSPNDVSGDGSVVVGTEVASGVNSAFVWDSDFGTRNLQDFLEFEFGLAIEGWRLTTAEGISDDGKIIVGHGLNPSGHTEAWLIDLRVPEPSSISLTVLWHIALCRPRHAFRR